MAALGHLLLVALLATLLGFTLGKAGIKANSVFFGVLSDWGGQSEAPYTTPGQVFSSDAAPQSFVDRPNAQLAPPCLI